MHWQLVVALGLSLHTIIIHRSGRLISFWKADSYVTIAIDVIIAQVIGHRVPTSILGCPILLQLEIARLGGLRVNGGRVLLLDVNCRWVCSQKRLMFQWHEPPVILLCLELQERCRWLVVRLAAKVHVFSAFRQVSNWFEL